MTFAEAAGIMIGGGGGTPAGSPKPDLVTYADTVIEGDSSFGTITEHYNVGAESEYTKQIIVYFIYKGTVNENISALHFMDKDGNIEKTVQFSGFYVG